MTELPSWPWPSCCCCPLLLLLLLLSLSLPLSLLSLAERQQFVLVVDFACRSARRNSPLLHSALPSGTLGLCVCLSVCLFCMPANGSTYFFPETWRRLWHPLIRAATAFCCPLPALQCQCKFFMLQHVK